MAFSLPEFNLLAYFYDHADPPPDGTPRFDTPCAWVIPRRIQMLQVIGSARPGNVNSSYLLLPTGLTIKTGDKTTAFDFVFLKGMYPCVFLCQYQIMVGAGHPNEHIQLEVWPSEAWPNLIPSPLPI